ncbi:MAG: PcaR/PcaU/PobR family beta-ketoadipate pathway transcriptional regulator [Bradyrhizobiaceae bacterium]|nr:MAG: PcaR/PcaU/PobR family beta-ketoadipate pathway transcriptional regulator [Bradyrhizobiaceae bacterium]
MAAWPVSGDTFVESFAKGLSVIAAFGHERALNLTQIARRTGLTRATARRLLHTLVALGFARHDEDLFMLTPRVLQLGFAYLSTLSLRDVAQPVIESLSRAADEVVGLSVLDDLDAVYIARAEVTSVLRRPLTVGSGVPAFCTSMGRVLLAGLDPDECASRLARAERRAWTRHTVTDADALMDEIARVRGQGWSLATEQLELGACGLAVAVVDNGGKVIAALNLSTNLARHTPDILIKTFLPRLREAADEIARQLPV